MNRRHYLLLLPILLLGATGCDKTKSLFYSLDAPQAIQRDTIMADGRTTTTIQNPEFQPNGLIKLVPVKQVDLVSVPVETPAGNPGLLGKPRSLNVPPGFSVKVLASGLGRPHDIVRREDGTLFVSDIGGRILAVTPDGRSSEVVTGLRSPHGLELIDGDLYYSDETTVSRYDFESPTATTGTATLLTDRIPTGGEFYTRTLRWVPRDERLYISVGATGSNVYERNREHATVLRMKKEGENPSIAMRGGLRNTVAMDVHPVTGELWGIDQGMIGLHEELGPAEVNILKIGKNYGYPYFYADNIKYDKMATRYPTEVPRSPELPVGLLQAYSLPTDLVFYRGSALGPDWVNGMLVVNSGYLGPLRDNPAAGATVIRMAAGNQGENMVQAPLFTGWESADGTVWGRPIGIAYSQDGKKFWVTDERQGVIYEFVAG